jgi:hypothetical protein
MNTSSVIGYRPSDDFYLPADLVNATLYLQVLLWHYLSYLLVYNILIIVCGFMKKSDLHATTITTTASATIITRHEDNEDGMHYLFTTTFCLCIVTFSVIGIIIGQSLFTIAFMITIPISCINTINNLLDSEFQAVKKFFGDEMIDTIANILLVLVEAASCITTSVYLYQVIMTRYPHIVAIFWPIRLSF